MTIKVWPAKKSAVGMKHPHGPQLVAAGAEWPEGSFTSRRLVDGSVTADENKKFVSEPDAAAAPSAETPAA